MACSPDADVIALLLTDRAAAPPAKTAQKPAGAPPRASPSEKPLNHPGRVSPCDKPRPIRPRTGPFCRPADQDRQGRELEPSADSVTTVQRCQRGTTVTWAGLGRQVGSFPSFGLHRPRAATNFGQMPARRSNFPTFFLADLSFPLLRNRLSERASCPQAGKGPVAAPRSR